MSSGLAAGFRGAIIFDKSALFRGGAGVSGIPAILNQMLNLSTFVAPGGGVKVKAESGIVSSSLMSLWVSVIRYWLMLSMTLLPRPNV